MLPASTVAVGGADHAALDPLLLEHDALVVRVLAQRRAPNTAQRELKPTSTANITTNSA